MKKLIILKILSHIDKKIILLISLATLLIFLILYIILNFYIFSNIKSEFIKFIDIKDTNNNLIPFNIEKKYLEEKKFKNIIREPIYYKNYIIVNSNNFESNKFLNYLDEKIIEFIFLSVLLLILISIIIIFVIKLKLVSKCRENENNQIQPLISHLSKIFSHDFKKPFNLLKMLLSNMERSEINRSTLNELNNIIISEINKSVTHIDSLIHDIIELKNETLLNNKILNIQPIIKDIINSTSLINELKKLNLVLNLNNTGKANIDLSKFKKVILTIISYTIKNNTNNDNFWIKTGDIIIKGKLFIFIEIGNRTSYIPKNEIEFVFNLFYFNKVKGNSGLELAICKKITESHNGFIKCSSNISSGTEFVIFLPSYNC